MNFVTGILLAPVTLPAKGIYYVFDKIAEQAEQEFNNPASIRAALINLQHRLDAGQITLERYEAAEAVLLARLDVIEARRSADEEAARPRHHVNGDVLTPTRTRTRRRRR